MKTPRYNQWKEAFKNNNYNEVRAVIGDNWCAAHFYTEDNKIQRLKIDGVTPKQFEAIVKLLEDRTIDY